MPQTFTIIARGRQQTVESGLTNEQALDLLSRCTGRFAGELLTAARDPRRGRPLSHAQWGWVHFLALEQAEREAGAAAAAAERADVPPLDLTGVLRLFRNGLLSGLRTPRLRFVVNGLVLRLSLAGRTARVPGSVSVTDNGRYPGNTFYGRIHPDGRWEPSARNVCSDVETLIRELAADPVAAAARYGHESGTCCFCGRPLTVSTVGYGPDCAERWGLPYDSVTLQEERSRGRRAVREEANYPRGGAIEAAMNTPPEAAGGPQEDSAGLDGRTSTATPAARPAATGTRERPVRRALSSSQRALAEDVLECMRSDGAAPQTLEQLARHFGLV